MKNLTTRIYILVLMFGLTSSLFLNGQPKVTNYVPTTQNFFDLKKSFDDYWNAQPQDQKKGWKQFKRWEYFWETRLMPDGTFPNGIDSYREYLSYNEKNKKVSALAQNIWTPIGPYSNPPSITSGRTQTGIGRVNVVRVKPNNGNEIWAGAASGGVWKSIDRGKTWKVLVQTEFMSIGVSDIAFSESDKNIVYVATGDADGIGTTFTGYSIGVIKSTDNGATWAVTGMSSDLSAGKIISKVIVNPVNPDIVFACASDGIYKTIDGGKTWKNKYSGIYVKDLKFIPENPDVLVGCTYGTFNILKSTDGGENWKSTYQSGSVTRGNICFSVSNPQVGYVITTSYKAFYNLLKTTDAGSTWTVRSSINGGAPNILGLWDGVSGTDKTYGQGWYDLALAVAPGDENTIFTGGINIWNSNDGGMTWNMITNWTGAYSKPYVHADIHDLCYDSDGEVLYCGSDGGLDYTADNGARWININNNINITQFYKISTAQTTDKLVYGGAQDNGSYKYDNGNWYIVNGGDGMDCLVDYKDEKRAYVSLYYGEFVKTTDGVNFYAMVSKNNTGEQGGWVTPIAINPVKSSSLYTGYVNVFKSVDYGATWKKISAFSGNTLKTLVVAPSDTNYIYAATTSVIYMTSDNGKNWKSLTGVPNPATNIEVDPANPNRIWVTQGGFQSGSKVFQYDGTKWTNISGNLPNFPVNCIIYQKNSPDRLYIGNEIGVFTSDYNSGIWEQYGSGLPTSIVSDLDINYKSKKLIVGTYSRGSWQTDLSFCNLAQPEISVTGDLKFCQGDSVILKAATDANNLTWSNGETTKQIIVKKSGIYSYSLPDVDGCKVRSKSVLVEINLVPPLKITPVGKYPLCIGDSINLELAASLGFTRYSWSTGDTVRKIRITTTGNYRVTAYTSANCQIDTMFEVKFNELPPKPEIIQVSGKRLLSTGGSNYQWYLNDVAISGATNQTLDIIDLGTYKVRVGNESLCYSLSDNFSVITSVKLVEFKSSDYDIMPNPSDGFYTIKFSNDFRPEGIKVTDNLGATIFERKEIISTKDCDIDIRNYPAGVYYIYIYHNNKIYSNKVIKN